MSQFSDDTHHITELIFQGVTQHMPEELCNASVLQALQRWQQRDDKTRPEPDMFRLDQTRSFTISYLGETDAYWPDEDGNFVGESLVREFLFEDGICNLDSLSPRLYIATYKVLAMMDVEYLLVCPYPTESGNIAGLIVICVNQHVRPLNTQAK